MDDLFEDPTNCWWCGRPIEDHVMEDDVYWCFGGADD